MFVTSGWSQEPSIIAPKVIETILATAAWASWFFMVLNFTAHEGLTKAGTHTITDTKTTAMNSQLFVFCLRCLLERSFLAPVSGLSGVAVAVGVGVINHPLHWGRFP